jgi:glycosyltransferase involved in cell wall biosynthesis
VLFCCPACGRDDRTPELSVLVRKPAVAVVIPTYNAGRFVSEAIESVRAQTTSQWECMIVDDGSTDETLSRLAAYRDSRIRWVRQENIGIHVARARGVSLTSAPKIVFLDADDRLYPDTLSRYVSFLDQHVAAGVAYGERTLINEDGGSFGLEWSAALNKHPQGDVLQSILRRPFLSTLSQACLRRQAVPPAEWLGNRGPMADWLLLAGAAIKNKFAYIGRAPLVKYRVRRSSLMRSIASDPQSAADIREFNEVLGRLFSFPGMDSCFGAAELAALRRAAEASCLAIKGQEFLRRGEPGAARRHFSAALSSGSRDHRDFLCWAATFAPALVRWSGPLFGVIDPHR